MKWLAVIVLLFTVGCAEKKPVKAKAKFVLPLNCIVAATAEGECKQISPELAECSGVIVKFACVKVQQ